MWQRARQLHAPPSPLLCPLAADPRRSPPEFSSSSLAPRPTGGYPAANHGGASMGARAGRLAVGRRLPGTPRDGGGRGRAAARPGCRQARRRVHPRQHAGHPRGARRVPHRPRRDGTRSTSSLNQQARRAGGRPAQHLSVTQLEVAARRSNDNLQGLRPHPRTTSSAHVLPRYGKTLYEWENDMVRQRLLMGEDGPRAGEGDRRGGPQGVRGEARPAPRGVRHPVAEAADAAPRGREEDCDREPGSSSSSWPRSSRTTWPSTAATSTRSAEHLDGEDPHIERRRYSN